MAEQQARISNAVAASSSQKRRVPRFHHRRANVAKQDRERCQGKYGCRNNQVQQEITGSLPKSGGTIVRRHPSDRKLPVMGSGNQENKRQRQLWSAQQQR